MNVVIETIFRRLETSHSSKIHLITYPTRHHADAETKCIRNIGSDITVQRLP